MNISRILYQNKWLLFFVGLISMWVLGLFAGKQNFTQTNDSKTNKKMIHKTDEEWKKVLSQEEFRILRKAGTERPNGKVYQEFKAHGKGVYFCVGCDTELFSSNEKFDSHCGWPSFFDPSKVENVKTSVDHLLGYPRTEVLCAVCDGHLGHVFKGEGFDTPTDKRYCINGTVLRFRPAEASDENKSDSPPIESSP
jgi:peptide-methionine (R)-S-oxide reductase